MSEAKHCGCCSPGECYDRRCPACREVAEADANRLAEVAKELCADENLWAEYPIDFADDGTDIIDRRLHCIFCEGIIEFEPEEHKDDCLLLAAREALRLHKESRADD